MHWKETGGVEKLFALPGRLLHSQPLFKHYQRNLTAKPAEDENVSAISVADPNPDPRVFGLPGSGSGSISQRYGSGSGSGSFYQ
jgi:hypothetical protein